MFRLLQRLCAPDRHPLPPGGPPAAPHDDDSIEEVGKKLRRMTEFAIQVDRHKVWHARLSGWHQSLVGFSSVNVALFLYSTWIENIPGNYYGMMLVAHSLIMSVFAKRIVKL